MHKSEPETNPTLITHVNKVYELRVGIIRTHKSTNSLKIQIWSWFNFEVDSAFRYR